MRFLTILKQSVKAIMSNKVRSFLTVLGIIIGIGSVIGLMSLGSGVKSYINSQINTLGNTNLTITSGSAYAMASNMSSDNKSFKSPMASSPNNLTPQDLEAIQAISKDKVSDATGSISTLIVIKSGEVEERVNLLGVSSNLFEFNNYALAQGNYPSLETEVVVGNSINQRLFGDADSVGQKIEIQCMEFTVSGVLETQNESSFKDPNNQIYITDKKAFIILGSENYSAIVVKATSEDVVDDAKKEIESVLLNTHGITDKSVEDFSITSAKDLLSATNNIMNMLTSFLIGIAAISLLVGGIGIMNIMLVSVTERTREIGLRKALGAKTSDILIQFMTEAVVLTILGGIFGMLLGYTIGIVAGKFLEFSAVITLDSVLLAVGISSFIGIVFGIYPAARAARLNPIDALRYE